MTLFVLTGLSLSASAAPVTRDSVENLYHWSYSAAFGTGFYRVGDERIFAFRFSPTIPLKDFPKYNMQLNLRLPITVGIQDLSTDIEDVASTLKTFSFVPGLELEYQAKENWQLKPFINYGWGREMDGTESAWIFFSGINSRYTFFKNNDWKIDLLNGLQWFRYDTNYNYSDSFARLVTGLEAAYRLADWEIRGYPVYLKPHLIHFWYFDQLGFSQITEHPVTLNQELEFGLALGSNKKITMGILRFDRIGVAYRVGDNSEAIRFFISSAFD